MLLSLLLGAATAAYFALQPRIVGLPFPNLQGEVTIRPTAPRLLAYVAGRGLGSLGLGVLAWGVGRLWPAPGWERLPFGLSILFALFIFLLLATDYSPEIPLARVSDPSRLRLSPFWLGLLSNGTLLAPMGIGFLFASVQHSLWRGLLFFTNMFCGHVLMALPVFLNLKWVKSSGYQRIVRGIIFFCGASALFLSLQGLLTAQ